MSASSNTQTMLMGTFPREWKIEPLKHHVQMTKGLPIQKTDLVDEGVAVISYGQIHSKNNTAVELKEEFIRYIPRNLAPVYSNSRLEYGDVVFADTSEDVEGVGNAILNTLSSEIYAGYHTVTCKPNNSTLDGRYFAYLSKTDFWRSQLRKLAMGVKVFSITQSILSRAYVLLPPKSEQRLITAALDKALLPIDDEEQLLVKQIDVLERYKKSLIHEAVTKGLDPDAPLKPSGVEWIYDIPRHWKIEPIKYHCQFFKGLPIQKTDLVDEGVAVISYGQIHSKLNTSIGLKEELYRYVPRKLAPIHSNSKLKQGDLVFADTSEDIEGVGNIAFIENKAEIYAGYHTVVCRPESSEVDGRYLAYLTKDDAWRGQLRSLVSGVKVYSVTQTILGKTKLLIPPINEQYEIADYLDEHCAKVDAILEIKRQQVEVLRKRRQSLIYEYVTGKRRVGEDF